ncbi:unknown [Haloarcula marismortui ATCC 43049]|uniref:DUF8130 domain-containing protein n=1 Tax=Haloarcula marismortui (strain ATCC 43049 / DSM 3752 / JCM 8966 / VKM B-1809) TaxID=272569 RepID=Q5V1N5_HALMA|nr:hypothetical protein [Haloarcula marismortui]AAV46567.1 unknown [Haloarcula marismortui ATCC 43049]QCP91282.1 hypothetical protein E6P14_10650 [Haloarcula marismortui ATCC 43049]
MNRRRYLTVSTAALSGLAGCLGDPEYTISSVETEDDSHPLGLDVTPVDREITIESPGQLNIALRNTGTQDVIIKNTGVWPLGVLGLALAGESVSADILLLADEYTEADTVEVRPSGASKDGTPLTGTLAAAESIERQYELNGRRVSGAGTYTLQGYFDEVPLSYRTGEDADWVAYHPSVTVTLTEQSVLP